MSKSYKKYSDDYDDYDSHYSGSKHRDRSRSPIRRKDDDEQKKIKMPLSDQKPKGIQIKLGSSSSKSTKPETKPKMTVASVFNQDSDSEPEEMPPEAKMRMRNIGRDTPTSAGPNSYGKTKHGFCDTKKVFEKMLKEAMNSADKN